jgi:hypothetical protein
MVTAGKEEVMAKENVSQFEDDFASEEAYRALDVEKIGVSGLYRWSPTTYSRHFEELRLDVDGYYPQLTASGMIRRSAALVLNWIAKLASQGGDVWEGAIWYKHGDAALLSHTRVRIQVSRNTVLGQQTATVTFSGAGAEVSRVYRYKSRYFHPVQFEFDVVEGEKATLSIPTCAHPNRPPSLRCETLTIQDVYRRAGFRVSTSKPGISIPLLGAGADALWSDQEMHDAMQAYWSRFADLPKWALWVFFASLHEPDEPGDDPGNLGGIMFDSIGPNHRQGTSIFVDSFISQAPAADPDPAAWVRRMIFWCACHEMGHAFNLAHSWQKSIESLSWIDMEDEPEARSFMNYPYRVSGGQRAYFADFGYRFSDAELLFMRHAPAQFVQMGNADWFDHHGFQAETIESDSTLALALRINRERPVYQFMEPVTLELKLTNTSDQPALVDRFLLRPGHGMTVVIKKDGRPARQFMPYARYCRKTDLVVLPPGQSMYEALYISSGCNGWDIAEPGNYHVQVLMRMGEQEMLSNPLKLRVMPPKGYDEESLAQDFFSEDVGRIVAFDGSRFLSSGNDVLREIADRLKDRRVSLHAALALGEGLKQDYKELVENRKSPDGRLAIKIEKADTAGARKLLTAALSAKPEEMAESLGHVDYKWYIDQLSHWLARQDESAEAYKLQDMLLKLLAGRSVHGRKVLPSVLDAVRERRDSYGGGKPRGAGSKPPARGR